jgi:uncharacterized protein (TIGR00369 family)
MGKNKNEMETPTLSTGPHRFTMDGWISCAPFEKLLHIDIVEAANGKAILSMPFLVAFAQGGGLMHGGALTSLADTAVVMAIKSVVPPKTHFATILLESKFLRPVKKGIITAKAQVFQQDKKTLKGEATLYDEWGRPVLSFSSTFKIARDVRVKGVAFGEGYDSG